MNLKMVLLQLAMQILKIGEFVLPYCLKILEKFSQKNKIKILFEYLLFKKRESIKKIKSKFNIYFYSSSKQKPVIFNIIIIYLK